MLKFDRQGLIPTVIQNDATGEILMVAFMNEEALALTRTTGYTHFYSRSRNAIWRKGEQSGNVQEVQDILVNCEENSLLIKVIQHGEAACHEGYRSCYFRRLQPDNSYERVAERIFDPEKVYNQSFTNKATEQQSKELEKKLRQLYNVYLYLRDHDLSEESNTSRLLQEHSQSYLVSRLGDELEELANVQTGEHIHSDRQSDTIVEGSQVGYWLLLLAAVLKIPYDEFRPHEALLEAYYHENDSLWSLEQRQNCLNQLTSSDHQMIASGLRIGFALIGWACAESQVSPVDPAEFDLAQMRRKGLIGQE